MGKARVKTALRIGAAVLIVALAIGLYKAKTDAARTEARVRQLQMEIADTEAEMRALRAEIAHLESPERVEALAKQHLGANAASESHAFPEAAIEQRLPAPRQALPQ